MAELLHRIEINLLVRMCSMWKCFRQFKEKRKTRTGSCFKATRNRSQQASRNREGIFETIFTNHGVNMYFS